MQELVVVAVSPMVGLEGVEGLVLKLDDGGFALLRGPALSMLMTMGGGSQTQVEHQFQCAYCNELLPTKRRASYHLRLKHGVEHPQLNTDYGKVV